MGVMRNRVRSSYVESFTYMILASRIVSSHSQQNLLQHSCSTRNHLGWLLVAPCYRYLRSLHYPSSISNLEPDDPLHYNSIPLNHQPQLMYWSGISGHAGLLKIRNRWEQNELLLKYYAVRRMICTQDCLRANVPFAKNIGKAIIY